MVVAACDELDHTKVVHEQFWIGRLTGSVEDAHFAKKSQQGRINYWQLRSDGRRDLGQLTSSRIPLHPEVVEAVRDVESFGTAKTAISDMQYAL
jgi:hypothetical protein